MTVACKSHLPLIIPGSLDTEAPRSKKSGSCIPDLQINDGCKKEGEQTYCSN